MTEGSDAQVLRMLCPSMRKRWARQMETCTFLGNRASVGTLFARNAQLGPKGAHLLCIPGGNPPKMCARAKNKS
jgi:hypothetical protein